MDLLTWLYAVTSGLECERLTDFFDKQSVTKALKSSIASMQYGNEDFLADLVAEACSKWCGGVVVGGFEHVTSPEWHKRM